VNQLVEANRRAWSVRDARLFGVRGPDQELVATTALFSDGQVAQVEDVYVVPEARGRGHGRAMVAAAAPAGQADHGLTFIVADDNDWPKQLYAKLGFKPVSRSWSFHRELS
jgi:ribosomal protein S18 acetylase RimI-like enzyme